MVPLSVLDLSPIVEGGTPGQSLRNSADLAVHAEQLGYKRFWMAEHHSMPGIASAATSVALAFVGSQTLTIRIGAGGVMLPNHAPLVIAETKLNVRTMPVSMAVMQLDLSETPVVMFRNAANGALNVVYRRKDGNVGWIDPERTRGNGTAKD